MRRRHLDDARTRLRRPAEATERQDVDDHLDAMDGAIADIDRWADGEGTRLARLRAQLEAMEYHFEPTGRDDRRPARASLRAYDPTVRPLGAVRNG